MLLRSLIALATAVAIQSCTCTPPPVEPNGGSGGAPVATSVSSSSFSAVATSSSTGGAACITPLPALVACVHTGDCWHGDPCSLFECAEGQCIYRARIPDRGGIVGCDPGIPTTGYWSCQGADPTSATAPGGRCCPDAAPLAPAVPPPAVSR